MLESLEALEANAMRLLIVGIGVFLLAFALFLFLNFRRMKQTVRGVRLLGRSSKAVFKEVIAVLTALELLAVMIGTSIAAILFNAVTEKILSSALMLRPDAMMTAAVAAFIFLMIATIICSAICANRKLMKIK